MGLLLFLHSAVRWLIVIAGLIAIIKFLVGWLRKADFQSADRALTSAFAGLMDLNVLLGLIFLVWTGTTGAGFPRVRIEHSVIMIIAALVAHAPRIWREAPDDKRFRNTLFAFIASLILVFLGVSLLPGGWSRFSLP